MPACPKCCGYMTPHQSVDLAHQGWYKCRTCGYSAIRHGVTNHGGVSDFSAYITSGVHRGQFRKNDDENPEERNEPSNASEEKER